MISVDEVKAAIRVTSSKLDDEVQSAIAAALLDLGTAGVREVDDALVGQAVKQYARWYFNYMGEADQYMKAYTDLKSALSLIPEYNGGAQP